ncbi:MAG: MBL fold metallo-hydrolase [Rickettsiales bacterium]|jgi:glyoxylase-like metal-dependent hydrolase (beta-lactamase superfamily II)|nr:MBL fold metallo-hydrolase [Rickettsiales bacterium]
MKIEIRTLGALENNCAILRADGKTYVFDPAGMPDDWRDLRIDAAFATHAHIDHISALSGLNVPWFMDADDLPTLDWSNEIRAEFFDLPAVSSKPLDFAFAPKIPGMEIIKTPGHSAGSACFYFPAEKILISGDTIFYNTAGRTDLPTGSGAQLARSIELLKNYGFSDDVLVIPGHGRMGLWDGIRRANSFLS